MVAQSNYDVALHRGQDLGDLTFYWGCINLGSKRDTYTCADVVTGTAMIIDTRDY